jgi:hypothetical protein
MYFNSENGDKTKLQPVITVPIANIVSNADLKVTEVIKVVLLNSFVSEGMGAVAGASDSPSKEGLVTVTTKKGRQSIQLGHYDPATGKTLSWWNVTALEFDVETETEALVVNKTGYYDVFNVVDSSKITLLAVHHMQSTEFANVGADVGDGVKNTKNLKVMNYKEAGNGLDGVHWRAEVENEYQKMLTNKVFKVVLCKDLPSGTKPSKTEKDKQRYAAWANECKRIQAI